MRQLLVGVVGALASAIGASASADDPALDVPEAGEVRDIDGAPTHELLLPPDVVARPGETPAEALARALAGGEPRPEVPARASRS